MLTKKLERPIVGGLPKSVLEVLAGGVGATEPSAFADALGALKASAIGSSGGVAMAGAGGMIDAESIEGASSGIKLTGPVNCQMGASATFTITNFDSYTTYTLSTLGGVGSVSRSGDVITYTAPSMAGSYGFTVNGKTYNVNVINPCPLAPSITSPVNGATGIGSSVTITGGAFSTGIGNDVHLASDWQIATSSDFTTVVVSSIADTINKTSWTASLPTAGVTYYARVRYKGTAYGYGAWSATISFTAKASFIPGTEESKIVASDKATSDWLGYSVAIDSTGARVIVGAYAADPSGITDAGAAYIFTRSGTTWTQEAKLVASDKADSDYFGYSIAIDSTGTRVIVGACLADPSGISDAGAAYIFTRSGATWTQEAKLVANDKAASDIFGYSVAIDSTGTRVIVGAYQADPSGITNAGAAYIFTRSGTTWTQEAKLVASDKAAYDNLGYSVAIDSTGTRVIVGAYRADPSGINDAGAAYIFTRSGTTWTQEAKLVASDKEISDYFGYSVAIDSTGTRVIVGAWQADPSGITNAGAAYIFTRSGTTWTEEAKLVASDKVAGDIFGWSVAIDSTGARVIVGAYAADPSSITNAGAAYIFTRSGTTWTQEAKLIASDKAVGGLFGASVAIDSTGTRVIVGAYAAVTSGIIGAGAAYIFS